MDMTEGRSFDMASHVPRMRRVALRFLGDPDDADEVVQEACLKAVRSHASFNGNAEVSTWLHSIVTRCALDRIRARRRHAQHITSVGRSELLGMLDPSPDGPLEQSQRKELFEVLNAAIASLPEDCRDAFALTQLDGYTYDEAAHIEGQPRGTIASRVYRAKRILIGRLQKELDREANHE